MSVSGKQQAKKWFMLIGNAIRERVVTVVASLVLGTIIGAYGTIVTIQPQLVSVTAKVAAIESNYITKSDFDHFIDKDNQRWIDQNDKFKQIIDLLKK